MQKSTFPLHPAQLDVYIDQFINTESPHYNIGGYIKFKGHLNKEKFQEAVNSSPKVFDAFKMRFDGNGQDFLCYFEQDYEKLEMGELDFSYRSNPEEEAKCWMQERFNTPFLIQKESLLFEQYLIKIADDEYWFFGRYHHLITDGYGFIAWVKYLAGKYNSLLNGDNLEFIYPPYQQEAIKASEYYSSDYYETDGRYWKEKINAKPKKFLQKKYRHQDGSVKKSTSYIVNLTKEQRNLLEDVQLKTKSGLQQLTIAALLIYFGKTSDNQSEYVFGVPVHKRGSKRLRNIVGLFSGILPYKGTYEKDIKLIDLLRDISQSQRSDYRHQNYLIGDLSRDLKINSSEGYLCEIVINHESLNFELVFGDEIEASIFQLTNEYELNPLQLCWREFGDQQSLELHVDFQYQYFSQAEIELLTQRIIFILEQFPAVLDKQISDINILPQSERFQLQVDFNNNKAELPEDKTILNLFEEQVSKTPNNIAVMFGDLALTYKELNERTNQLGHYLRGKGVKEETLVPICIERSLEMIIGLLGIMKAGGAYVPLDPEYPQERINFMLEDTGASLVISNTNTTSKLSIRKDIAIIELDADWVYISKESISPLQTALKSDHLAYMIYTSGSTGKPKGVMIEHRSLINFVFGFNKVLPLDENDHLLAITSISFDISILELFWTLCRGIKVTIKGDGKALKGFQGHLKNGSGATQMDFSLFYFSSQVGINKNKYDFLLRSVKFADNNKFSGIWLPERHFHEFGGIFPNPAVIGAGLATITSNVEIRAGSVVLPLNDVIRVAEGWSIVDNLSNGRVSLSIASGWHADDFVLMPENYAQRHEIMFTQIEELKALWRGSGIRRINGLNKEIDVKIFPRPLQSELPIWITSAGNSDTFKGAGKIGAKILTHLLGQKIEDLQENILIYKQSLKENGYSLQQAKVALMLHTYIGTDFEKVKSEVREPFKSYLRSNISLIKNLAKSLNIENFEERDLNEMLEIAFERYWQTSALLGTHESCQPLIEKLYSIGVTEIACLIDFGVEDEKVIESLTYLNDLRQTFHQPLVDSSVPDKPISSLQITPSYLSALIEDEESQLFLKSLRHLIVGGEKLPDELVRKLSICTDAAIYNMYGPTETTIWSTSKEIDINSKVTIGRPIQNTSIYILDEEKNVCPIGVLGELFIGGDGLARGYYNNAALTQERFITNPFRSNSSDRIYKTGDLAKWLPNGDIELAGRNDDQIKLSGYRIEPDEIEHVINQSAGVKKSVVTAKEDANGNKTLVAYIQVSNQFNKTALYAQLKSKLPHFMVPSVIMELEEFPLTSNGKINRNALPAPDAAEQLSNQYVAPRNVIEQTLANILVELLGAARIGIHDNFFGLGLHSLLALRLVSATRRKLEVELAVKELFIHPTIAELAGHLQGLSKGLSLSAIKSQLKPERIPLSFGQERLWFIDQLHGSVQYHLPAVFALNGHLKRDALENALQTIINRHEVLRTVIREVEGQPYQCIKEKDEWQLGLIDGHQFQQDPQALQQYIKTLTSRPFDLSRDHMLRASLIILNEQEHLLVLTFHHIASDAWSTSLFVKEVVELYKSYDEGRPVNLEQLEIQYADFAIWQRQYLQGELLNKKLSYWQEKLQGVTPLQLPADYARPAVQSTKGVNVAFRINEELSANLQSLSQQQGTTLFMTLLAAFKVLLYRYSGQQDICVGTSIAGRQHEEVEGLMGFFSNTLALRTEVSEDALFTGLLQTVRTTTLEAYEHQEVPFEKVVEAVVKERDMGRSPLFQVMFVLQNTPEIPELHFGDVQLSQEAFSHNTSKFDLTLFISETKHGLQGSVEYSPELFSEQTIGRMMGHFKELLGAIVKRPDQGIGKLSMLTDVEQHQLVVEFNNSLVEYPGDKSVVDLFEEQVLKTPQAVAVVFEGQQLTYQEFNERSNRLAHYLRSRGVREEMLVPICIERSIEMMIGIMGILKSGGAYVPIDTDFPSERINYMLEDTRATIVVSSSESSSKLQSSEGIILIELDTEDFTLSLQPSENLQTKVASHHLAYVIYTSGSTGKPKGVMIEHRSLVDYVFGLKQNIQIHQCRSFALVSTIATDLGNTVIYSSLVLGGALHLFSKESVSNTEVLHSYFEEHAIECLKIVPSHWRALSMQQSFLLPSKLLIFGGEALQAELVENIKLTGTSCTIVNHYGPTETTIGKLLHVVRPDSTYNNIIPIGRPFSNTRVYVLTKDLETCPIGISGQLYIEGDGVARGYLNNDELSGKKFIRNPYSKEVKSLMYGTGDVVKYLPDGNIVFLGRVDDQVKIRGYRVELGEVESVLYQCDVVRQAVVMAKEDSFGDKRLVGYIVAEPGRFDKEVISSYVKDKLPDFMIPALWVELEGLPLTPNGKVDRRALPDPEANEGLSNQYVAPRNETEHSLATIWKAVLDVDQVGIHDDFFELGGHSLLAVRLISAIRKGLSVEMPISDIFDYPTIESLARNLESQSSRTILPSIKAGARPELIPLSFSQERLWFIDQLEGSVQYHVPGVLGLMGQVNKDALQYALQTIVNRHEVLRTVIREAEGQAWQYIKDKDGWQLDLIEGYEFQQNQKALQQYIERLINEPFDLSKDYMLRGHLITLGELKHVLVVTLHHIASDAWSRSVLVKEVVELYGSYVEARLPNLTPLSIQYADYAMWQRKYLQGELLDRKLNYWKAKLQGFAPLQLPADFARPAVQSTKGASTGFSVDKELSAALQLFSQQQGTTLFMTLLAAFKVLLHRYSGQQDICVGSPIAGRQQEEVEDLIGFFVNTLALRSEVNGESSFSGLLQQVKTTTLEAYEHQEVPFEKVVDSVVTERDMSRNPLFQVMFVWQNTPEVPELRLGEIILSRENYENTTSKFDLILFITETLTGLEGSVEYSTDLYSEPTIVRMIDHFKELLSSIIKQPEQSIAELQMLSQAEKVQLLEEFNNTRVEYPKDKSIADLFEEQVQKTPDLTALVLDEHQLTYKELNERSNQLAHYLRSRGVRGDTLVPICIERSLHMIIGVLGILKAGGAYVPIDPDYPADRIKYIVEDTEATLIVSSKGSSAKLPNAESLDIIELDGELPFINKAPADNLVTGIKAHHLAYVLYTSGSTGKPKGVKMSGGSLVNLLTWQQKQFENKRRRVLQFASLNFDVSFQEIFSTLPFGSALYLINADRRKDMSEVFKDLSRYSITHLYIPYIVLKNLAEYSGPDFNLSLCLEEVIVAGEQLKFTEVIKNFIDRHSINLINQYGPTEAHVVSSYVVTGNTARPLPPIGKPIDNTFIYITRGGQLSPIGVGGEICIGGVQVARGYLNRPELTAEKFVADPFNKEPGARLYKTGDLGRWLADGNIEYLGRIDDQVKIRGYRIELGEIESILQECRFVNKSVVLAKEYKEGVKQLVGYVVPDGPFDPEAIISFLKTRLPEYMVPSLWVELDNLPVTPNGKIDRKALPESVPEGLFTNQYVAPRTQTEQALVNIWQELLDVSRVGVHDNFFELGGHSLLATRVISSIRRQLEVELAIKDLFIHPTIAELAGHLNGQSNELLLPAIKAEPRPQLIPLSFSQERLWFIDQLNGSGQYHLSAVFGLKGRLNKEALEHAFQTIVGRHEVLRTVVREHEGQAWQYIKDKNGWQLIVTEGYQYKQDSLNLQNHINTLVRKPFDLSKDDMLRADLIILDLNEHMLVVTMHHIASDGWSISIIVQEVIELYKSYAEGRPAALVPLEIQYADYAIWQRKYLQGEVLEKKLGYWKEKLQGVEPIQLPTDYSRPSVPSHKGSVLRFNIDKELSEQLLLLSRQENTTLFMTLLAVFNILLHRYSNQEDICVGTSSAGRRQQEIEGLIGFFVNTLVLRTAVNGDASFPELLQQVKATTLEGYEHQDVPFEKVVDAVVKQRDMSRNPLAQVMFVLHNTPQVPDLKLGELTFSNEPSEHTTAQFDLTLFITETVNGLQGSLEYSTDLYSEPTMQRMVSHFIELLNSVITNPKQKIGLLPMLTMAEEHQLVVEFNANGSLYPKHRSITDLFEEQVLKTPAGTAVVFEGERLSYLQLDERSNQLAHYLRSRGVKEETLVPLCIERSLEMIIGILGILKAGGAYVPIDAGYPEERISYMLKDIGCKLVVTTSDHVGVFEKENAEVVCMDRLGDVLSAFSGDKAVNATGPDSLAYVMYTSGSTGKPKGVMVEHRNVVSLVRGIDYVSLSKEDILLSTGSPSFDATTFEYWSMLLNGGQLILCTENKLLDSELLKEEIDSRGVTKMWFTSSWFNQLVETDISVFEGLGTILVGGEKLSEQHIKKLRQTYGDVEIINGYGPTENTTFSLTCKISGLQISGPIPIGRPLSNRRVYVLDEWQRLVPVGVAGELYLGGDGLGRGYLNRPELTAEKFIADPFNKEPGARLYKTGDLGRWLADGNIEYLGRLDDQVKIRGYRIEPGEIESVLMQSGLVSQAVVMAKEDKEGRKRLVGYIVLEGEFDKEVITGYLKGRLPEYMLPALWVQLEQLPLTPNGKLDKRALPDPEAGEGISTEYTAPRNELEANLSRIWQELLDVERVGIYDNFFELGGDSLLAIRLISAIRRELVVEMPISDIFEYSTIASLAGRVSDQSGSTILPSIEVEPRVERIPLSFSQERLWFIDRLSGSLQYHIPAVLRLKGRLNTGALQYALQTIVSRHEVLRTVIREQDGEAWQYIKAKDNWQLAVIDGDRYREDVDALGRYIQELVSKPFDLSQDDMLRATLILLNEGEQVLVVTMHHIASDGWSRSILVKEVVELYGSYEEGRLPGLPVLSIQYADYAMWQRKYLRGALLEGKISYWKDKLRGVEPLDLPSDYARPAVASTRGALSGFWVDKEISSLLQVLSQREGTTLFMTLLSVFKVFLYRYSGQQDICVGTSVAGRQQQETEGLMGFFINTLALRSELRGDHSFTRLLQQVKATTLEAYEHQEVPFEKVVDAVVQERDMSRNPLFQVLFVLQNTPEVPELRLGQLTLSSQSYVHSTAQFDLNVSLTETAHGLYGSMEYSTDLYSEQTIGRMISHFKELLGSVVREPEQQIGKLPMLTGAEKHQLLVEFNDTVSAYSKDRTVIDLFEEQVLRTPQAMALVFEEEQLSYGRLNERSNRLAHYLRSRGVREETLVPICIEPGIEMIVGILGILKAGGAYVPIDADYPLERIGYILEDTGAGIVVSSRESKSKLPTAAPLEIIALEGWSAFESQPVANVKTALGSGNLAYVIYTSGSTGKPKGVMIEHRSLLNYLLNSKSRYMDDKEGGSGSFIHLSYTFDASLTGMMMPLLFGKSIVIGSKRSVDVFEDSNLLKYAPYDFIKLTPSHLELLQGKISGVNGVLLTGRLVIGGEALQGGHFNYFIDKGVDVEIINEYGPTEATVGCSTYRFTTLGDKEKLQQGISIGKPLDNVQLFVLDEGNGILPVGVVGEICIGGDGLARGYLNAVDLTGEKFMVSPFSKEGSGRLYKTGDLGRWSADGNLEYVGRRDDQVKIRGYRIEPGEIESVLLGSELVNQAVVMARDGKEGSRRLVGYVVASGVFDKEAISAYLKSKLPEYMVPALWVELDSVPLTINGKIDRKALPDPDATELLNNEYVAPRNQLEATLAEIWQELLEVEQVGIHDNFFELGGDSIIIIQVVSRARRSGYELQVADILTYQTIARLSAIMEQRSDTLVNTSSEQELLMGPGGLLPIQQWYLENDNVEISHFNQSVLLGINKDVTEPILRGAIEQLTEHHDAMRFQYRQKDGHWEQEYGSYKAKVLIEDLRSVQHNLCDALITEHADRYQRSLDIEKGELVRVILMLTPESDAKNRLLIVIHHLAVDGVSWRILLEDVELLLGALTNGQKADLGKKSSSYRQWYDALRKYGQSSRLFSQKKYWQKLVESYDPLVVDKDYHGQVRVKDMASQTIRLGVKQTWRLIHEVPRIYHTEINDILLSALARTLCEWNGSDKVIIGLEGHGREMIADGIDTSSTVGWFTNLYPVLLDAGTEKGEGDLIKSVKEQLRQVPDKGLGYGVLKYINKEEVLQGKDRWEIVFNYLGQLDNVVRESKWLTEARESTGASRSDKFVVSEKISVTGMIQGGELIFSWSYSSNHYEKVTIRSLAQEYLSNLEKLITHCTDQQSNGDAYTPSDYGLGSDISYEELDGFLNERL